MQSCLRACNCRKQPNSPLGLDGSMRKKLKLSESKRLKESLHGVTTKGSEGENHLMPRLWLRGWMKMFWQCVGEKSNPLAEISINRKKHILSFPQPYSVSFMANVNRKQLARQECRRVCLELRVSSLTTRNPLFFWTSNCNYPYCQWKYQLDLLGACLWRICWKKTLRSEKLTL